MKYAREVIIILLIAGLVWLLWQDNQEDAVYEGRIQKAYLSRDSAKRAAITADTVALKALTRAARMEARNQELILKAVATDKKHEKFVNRPVVPLTDSAVFRAIRRLRRDYWH